MNDLRSNKKLTLWRSLSILLIIITLAGIGGAAWYYLDKVSPMTEEISDLKSDRDQLQDQLAEYRQIVEESTEEADDTPNTDYRSNHGASVSITSPLSGAQITSPVEIEGTAPGNWFNEDIFNATLKDSDGTVVAQTTVKMEGTDQTKPANFTGELSWTSDQSGSGILVLEKANPSGLESNTDQVQVAIKF